MGRKLRNRPAVKYALQWVVMPLGRRAWRHRAGLLPFWWTLAFLVGGWVLAALWPTYWPLPGLAGSAVAAVVWFCGPRMSPHAQRAWMLLVPDSLDDGKPGVLDRATERGYLAILFAGGGSWLSARMQYSWTPGVEAFLLVLLLVLGVPWWWHRGWRRKKPLNIFARRWPRVEQNEDLKPWHGSTVVSAVSVSNATLLVVRLRGGRTVLHVGGDALTLCSMLGLRPGAVTVSLDPDSARRVLVRIVPRDPWTSHIPHPMPALRSLSLDERPLVRVGSYEDGSDDMHKLECHRLVCGGTGSGKSEWLQSLIAWMLAYENSVIVGADLAGGSTLDVWEDVLAAPLATSVPEAYSLLDQVFRLIQYRERLLTERRRSGEKINVLPVTPEHPAVFVIIDEFPDLVSGAKMEAEGGEKLDVMTRLERIAKKARKCRVWLTLAAQNPTKDDVGSTTLRAQLTATVGLGLDQQQSKNLWQSLRAQGWDSEPLSVGTYLLRDRNDKEHQQPRVAKGLWLSPDSRNQLIEKASRRPGNFSGTEAQIVPSPQRTIITQDPLPVLEPAGVDGKPQLRLVRENPPVVTGTGPRLSRSADLDDAVFAEVPDPHQGGIGQAEIAGQLGVSPDRVKRSFKRLADRGLIRSRGDRTWTRR